MPFIYIAIRGLQEILFLQREAKERRSLEEFRGLSKTKMTVSF